MRKTKLFKKILAVALSAALMGNVLCVQAAQLPEEDAIAEDVETEGSVLEYVLEEEPTTGDMEISFPASESVETAMNFENETFDVSLTGNEVSLYGDSGIKTINAEEKAGRESIQHYGTVSDYLSDTGDYELYSLNLPAGDYLQARLTVPNNTSINYALVLYDSELNVIKMSHYIPYLNEGKTLEESIGYLPTSDELIYIGVFSLVGGSATEAYTLDFSITTNYSELSDPSEPDENVQEATTLNLGRAGASVSGILNSAIDNDWYSFTVIGSSDYDKMRLKLTSNSSVNGCELEIYKNLTEDYFTMQFGGSGIGEGEVELPVGTYYIRVVSTNTFNDFNIGEMPVYNLSVVPVARVDGIKITQYHGSGNVYGMAYDLPGAEQNWINIVGIAYYMDSENMTGSANVKLKITVINTSWESLERQDMSTTYETAITRDDGFFHMTINLNKGLGLKEYSGDHYDYMRVEISPLYAPEKKFYGNFRLVKKFT